MTPVDKYALHPRLTFAESSILKSRNVVPKLEITSGSSKFLIQIHLLLYSSMFDEILFDFMGFVLWFCFGPFGTLRTGDVEDSDVEDTTLRTCDFEDKN